MPACRTSPLTALAAATAGVLLTLAAAAPAARAQSEDLPAAAPANNTLELTLETGTAAPPAPRPAAKAAAPRKTASRFSGPRLTSLPLPSRAGGVSRTALRAAPRQAPKVLAQLGVVLVAQASLRVSREPSSRLLSVVQKGTHLAVVADMGDCWGVLMVNNTIGWLPKSDLELINYQTEVSLPPPDAAPAAPTAAESASGQEAGLPAGLSPVQESLLKEAFTYLGVPYVWAGNTRSGIDCSGFVKNVFARHGKVLPRHSGDQAKVGIPVAGPDLQPGDRLYFDMKRVGRISHTGIYIGNGYFIHSSTNRRGVGVDSIFKPGYLRALVCARRDFE